MHSVLPRQPEPWLNYWVKMAQLTASRSKDPNTQVGAVIVNQMERQILGLGYNGPPSAFEDSLLNWDRPQKYEYVMHAEINAIYNAIDKVGILRLHDATIITTVMPCAICLLNLIACKMKGCYYLKGETAMVDYVMKQRITDIAVSANFDLKEVDHAKG